MGQRSRVVRISPVGTGRRAAPAVRRSVITIAWARGQAGIRGTLRTPRAAAASRICKPPAVPDCSTALRSTEQCPLASLRPSPLQWGRMTPPDPKLLTREILLGFWKVHILHHAAERPVFGQWILTELRRHGYDISPGTLYPLLKRMERNGWLRCEVEPDAGSRARRYYHLTPGGAAVLEFVRETVVELHHEVVEEATASDPRKPVRLLAGGSRAAVSQTPTRKQRPAATRRASVRA